MIQPIYNNYLITADIDGEMPTILGANGEKIPLGKEFNPLVHATQFGEVVRCPLNFDNYRYNKTTIREGDRVFMSYDVVQLDNQFFEGEKELYFADWEVVVGKVDGDKLIPTNDYFFATKFYEAEQDSWLYKEKRVIPHKAKVVYTNEIVEEKGIKAGDTILTMEGAGVPIKGTDLFYMRPVGVYAIERDGEIFPLKGKGLIQEYPPVEKIFGKIKFSYGMFLKGDIYPEGKEICFIHGGYSKMNYNGINYAVVEKRNLVHEC